MLFGCWSARDGLAIVQILTRCQEKAAQAVAATSVSCGITAFLSGGAGFRILSA